MDNKDPFVQCAFLQTHYEGNGPLNHCYVLPKDFFFSCYLECGRVCERNFFDISKILSKSCMSHVSNVENIAKHLWECHSGHKFPPKGSGVVHGQCEKLHIKVVVILLVCLIHHLLFIILTSYVLCCISKSRIKHQEK